MRMETYEIRIPTWSLSEYGEPVAEYNTISRIHMKIGWNSMADMDTNDSLYKEFDLVGLTRALPPEGSLIDGKYVVGHVEPGRWNRVFMKYAEGKDREYVEPEPDSGEDS